MCQKRFARNIWEVWMSMHHSCQLEKPTSISQNHSLKSLHIHCEVNIMLS